jgi:transposase InsO family protein
MEEQEARPTDPGPKRPGRPQYTPEHRKAVLEALAAWKGTRKAFCAEHKVPTVTLWQWQKDAKGGQGRTKPKAAKATKKGARKQTSYTPEQRRKAVEAFNRSGQTLDNFGKAWGINATVLGRWTRAYRKEGPQALEGRRGRKKGRKPVADGLREGIKQVKEQFPDFGMRKVGAFLARFKGLKASRPQIKRVVEEEQLPKGKTAEKRWRNKPVIRRFERSKPGELWQTDITSFVLPRHSQRVYLVAFMDDYSRYVVAWKLGVKQTTDFVQEALLEGIQRFGKPEELLSDQGRQYFAWRGKSEFQKLLTKQGIQHVVSRAHHPETLGKCERFWGTVGEEFWSRVEPQELLEAQERLAHFINHYNHFRPHQGIDNSTPADRFFGAESQVRQAIESAWTQNQLAMALNQPTRQPVFLVGQIGDQSVSLHGERGKLVLQTSEGVRQELVAHDLGMAQVFPLNLEKNHGRNLDSDREQSEHGNAHSSGFQAPQTGGQAQDGLPDGYPAIPGAGDLGAGPGGGAPGGAQDRCADPGALAGPNDPQGSGDQAQPATVAGVAAEPTSAGRDGGGADGPAQAAAEGDAHGESTSAGQGRAEDAAQGSGNAEAGQPSAEGTTGSAQGHAWAGGGDSDQGEKNQPSSEDGQSSARESEPGCGVQADTGVTETSQPPFSA